MIDAFSIGGWDKTCDRRRLIENIGRFLKRFETLDLDGLFLDQLLVGHIHHDI